MATYTYPGVYIEERRSTEAPIQGVSASAFGVVGWTEKGPVDEATLVTSFEEFTNKFGSFMQGWQVPLHVNAFFQNQGRRAYIVRIVPDDAVKASWDIKTAIASEIKTLSPVPDGARGEDLGTGAEREFSVNLSGDPQASDNITIDFATLGTPIAETGNAFGDGASTTFVFRPGINTAAIALLNDIRTLYIAHLNSAAPGGAHVIADVVNTIALAACTDEASFVALVNQLVTQYNAHDADAVPTWHLIAGPFNPVTLVAAATDWNSGIAKLLQLKTAYNAHVVSLVAHSIVNTTTALPDPDWTYNKTAAAAADYKLEPGSVSFLVNSMVPATLQDQATGLITGTPLATAYVHYETGVITLNFTVAPLLAVAIDLTGYRLVVDRGTGTITISSTGIFTGNVDLSGINTINRETGAITFTTPLTHLIPDGLAVAEVLVPVPYGDYTDNTTTVDTSYFERYWLISAKYEGAWGGTLTEEGLKISFEGDPDYFDNSTQSYSKYIFKVYIWDEQANGYVEKESYNALQMDDATLPKYFPDVINDPNTGSDYVEVIEPGDDIPVGLNGAAVTAEVIGAGTGVVQHFTHTLVALPGRKTIDISFTGSDNVAYLVSDDGYGNLIEDPTTPGALNPGGNNTVNYDTGAIDITTGVPVKNATNITCDYYSQPTFSSLDYDNSYTYFTVGSNGTLSNLGYTNTVSPVLETPRRGIYAFKNVEEALNVGIPDFAGNSIIDMALVSACEAQQKWFAILSVPEGLDAQEAVHYRRNVLGLNSSYAALYGPWVTVTDPILSVSMNVNPIGWIAGVYARTDSIKTIGKAPAGQEDGKLLGIIGMESIFDLEQIGTMYQAQVNPLLSSNMTGRCVWGAKTLEIGGEFGMVHARRLFMYLKLSVYLSTWWIVFENNSSNLRLRVKQQIRSFLKRLFGLGYFAGNTEQEAFLVVCDNTNNTDVTLAAGMLICDIYVAVNKPAEFVTFRFQQKI